MELSLCLIVKNEARRLPDLLASLPLDEIEVIAADTGSTDATVEILRGAGIEPLDVPWVDDFSAARNATVARATRRFVLWLDADDRVTPAFWQGLRLLLKGPSQAYRCIVRSPREDGSGEAFRQLRLFPNGRGITFEGRIHEQLGSSIVRAGVAIRDSELEILHLGYATEGERTRKLERNLKLLESEWREQAADSAVALQYGNALVQAGRGAEARRVYASLLPFGEPEAAQRVPQDERLRLFPALMAESFEKDGQGEAALRWHRLAWHWAPDYLRSGYRLARMALEQGDVPLARALIEQLLNQPVRIGLVACDNAGVRRNALALGVLLAESASPESGLSRLKAAACLEELIQGGRVPLDPQVVLARLARDSNWESLTRYLHSLRLDVGEERQALEDGVEALLLQAPAAVRTGLDALFAQWGESLHVSPVLAAFAAMREEVRSVARAWERFCEAVRLHPEDPTVVGQFCAFVERHALRSEALAFLQEHACRGPLLDDIVSQLRRLALPAASRSLAARH